MQLLPNSDIERRTHSLGTFLRGFFENVDLWPLSGHVFPSCLREGVPPSPYQEDAPEEVCWRSSVKILH